MAFSFKKILSECVQWIYPSLCLCCGRSLFVLGPLFCSVCLENLPLSEERKRCARCFFELGKGGCQRCRSRRRVIGEQMAALEAVGPARSLLREVQKGERKAVAAAASLMVYQWLKRERPLPDGVVPLPLPWIKRLGAEGDPHRSLAAAVAKLLDVPLFVPLKASYAHAQFIRGEPMHYTFTLRSRLAKGFADQRLLLVAPTLEDQLLREAGIALLVGGPASIDALALCVEDL